MQNRDKSHVGTAGSWRQQEASSPGCLEGRSSLPSLTLCLSFLPCGKQGHQHPPEGGSEAIMRVQGSRITARPGWVPPEVAALCVTSQAKT